MSNTDDNLNNEKHVDFVHLHVHTEYSLLDGACRIKKDVMNKKENDKVVHTSPLIEKVKEYGMKAIAITDHGNMYGVYNFVNACHNAIDRNDKDATVIDDGKGIKAIIGEEFYVAKNMRDKSEREYTHLILLAKNATGYFNMMQLSTKSFIEGFYYKPRIDLDLLKQYSEGIICLSACLAGQIPRYILANDYAAAKSYALELKSIFADGDFYIELQDHGLEEDKIVVPQLVKLAREIGVDIVATNDAHYLSKEDYDAHDTLVCIQSNELKTEKKPGSMRFETNEFYLKTGEEMLELFKDYPEAIENTVKIADKIESFFCLKRPPIIPEFHNDEMGNMTEEEYIRFLAERGLKEKYSEITPELLDRLNYELKVINDCGYNGYFLIVWDYVNAAKEMGIPVGPGRGSGCGSLVAYCIGITAIDPIRYGLLFERFLNKDRVSMPDFDVDFCFVRRQEVIDYCIKKYGEENVSQIIAYSTMSAKAVLKDVARVYDISYREVAEWLKNVPTKPALLLEQVLTPGTEVYSPQFKKLYEDDSRLHEIVDVALKLEGLARQTSMHAAGVVICRDPVRNHVAMSVNKGDDKTPIVTTQFDKNVIEDVGLLKMDFLGLKTLTDISEALKLIEKDKGVKLDMMKIDYEDQNVYKLISSGNCKAIFQLESAGMTKFMRELQPDRLEDIVAGIALYRPGPMQFLKQFIKGKKNPDEVEYLNDTVKEILQNTYGCIVYQEQVMQIMQKLAGFSFGAADIIRRAMSKKKKDLIAEAKHTFLYGGKIKGVASDSDYIGVKNNGVSVEDGEKMYSQIEQFANYAFNKSHAVAYTYLTYQTAYLMCYYPTYFLVSVINNRINNSDEVKNYVNYLKSVNVKMLPPDINRSEILFSIDKDNVRYGLAAIRNNGQASAEMIIEERKKYGEYKDLKDFFKRCGKFINKRLIESYIMGGAFDCFGKTRSTLMASYEEILGGVTASNRNSMQLTLFDLDDNFMEVTYHELPEYPKEVKLKYEFDALGMYVTGHPLDDYGDEPDFNFNTGMIYLSDNETDEDIDEQIEEGGEERLKVNEELNQKKVRFGGIISEFNVRFSKNNARYVEGKLQDRYGEIAFNVFGKNFTNVEPFLEIGVPLKFRGTLNFSDGDASSAPKVVVFDAETWDRGSSDETLFVHILRREDEAEVVRILSKFRGNVPCRAQVKGDDGKQFVKALDVYVKPADELYNELYALLGQGTVKLVKNK